MLKFLGILCVVLAVIGIFLPLLPTTPFLLLAMYLFARSSEKYRQKILDNKFLRPYVEPYVNKDVKMPNSAKIKTIVLLWVVSLISAYLIENIHLTIFLLVMSTAVSIHILLIGRKNLMRKHKNNNKMIQNSTQVRVRYGEVDRMGFYYHSHYVELFDIGRTELMRNIGLTNFTIESYGIELPVCKVDVNYRLPALYDDLLTVKTELRQLPTATIRFDYTVFRNASGEETNEPQQIATGFVVLAFMSRETKKACRPPAFLMDTVRAYFK